MTGRTAAGTTVVVHGTTLAGLAAAIRLAKAGHRVLLDTAGEPLGGHWAGGDGVPDSLPQTVALRAAWMDLLRKSGRAFDAELARHHLTLAPAPPTEHLFPDGRRLLLPAERGAQFHAVADAFGEPAAERWSTLLDEAGEVWLALRRLGAEHPRPPTLTRDERRAVWARHSLEQIAARLREPHLARVVTSLAPISGAPDGSAPALLLTRAAIDRQFGRWNLVDEDTGHPQPAGKLIDVLVERLAQRRVEVHDTPDGLPGHPDAELDARPAPPTGWLGRRTAPPALAPAVRRDTLPRDTSPHDGATPLGIACTIEHHDAGPIVRWRRPAGEVIEMIEHDHRSATPSPEWGLAPASWRSWLARPSLHGPDGRWQASAAGPAGNEPWAELLSAALAVYEIHESLTGEDIRPTNRGPRAPRPS